MTESNCGHDHNEGEYCSLDHPQVVSSYCQTQIPIDGDEDPVVVMSYELTNGAHASGVLTAEQALSLANMIAREAAVADFLQSITAAKQAAGTYDPAEVKQLLDLADAGAMLLQDDDA